MLNKEMLLNLTPKLTGFASYDVDDDTHWYNGYNFRVENPERYQAIFGWYTEEDYSGHAYLFGYDKEQDKFFEVLAWHCSCYGLEEGWDPDYFETVELLHAYLVKFNDEGYESAEQLTLIAFLKENGIEL